MPQTRKVKAKSEKKVLHLPSQHHYLWTVEDKRALVRALQLHGFGDLDKLSEEIKSKTKNEIELFIGRWKNKVQRDATKQKREKEKLDGKQKTGRRSLAQEIKYSSELEIWDRIITSSTNTRYRNENYSTLFEEVFRNAATNEKHAESKNGNQPNFKTIYKYFQDILSSNIPAVVSPADSAIILSLMQDLTNFISSNKLQAERSFLKSFWGASNYYPVIIKKEPGMSENNVSSPLSKKAKQGSANLLPDQNNTTLPGPSGSNLTYDGKNNHCDLQCGIPDEWFDELHAHKKAQENLNALTIPVYMLEKEAKIIKKYLKDEHLSTNKL